ncbi:snaclec stejaggregin-B subunit beta-1-like [Myxocyprinus asiaticus]|uniref:snaclec stejaggregin-B subunit beta-1-like n=1 Tax=Myxocyprinus asiaticus TaxID=70543 RepID=UPI002222E723|nr:snaclec stejaggregin-B subunit beta-1-like [Myxocyprinus asiaticus]
MKTTGTVLLFLSFFGLNSSVYRFHYFVNQAMNWHDAQKYCREHYDDLSTVNSQDLEPLSNYYYYIWLGLQTDVNLKTWNWSEGGKATINGWGYGEHSIYYKRCGFLYMSHLYDSDCSWTIPFYCMEVYELILVQQEKTWEEALDYCRQHYIDLAIINIEMIMAEARNTITAAQTEDVWTGLRFLAGHWFWVNGDDVDYTSWSAEGELQCPAMSQRCGVLNRNEKVWKPRDCDRRLNFLCVRRASFN